MKNPTSVFIFSSLLAFFAITAMAQDVPEFISIPVESYGLLFESEDAIETKTQDSPNHRLSPVVIEHQTVDDTYMKVVYGQPYKRNRTIFGELVPYGEVWRAGANEATEITVTNDILFGGKHLSEGTYSLFAIPEEDVWTLIINSGLGQWGAYSYDESKDVLRVEVPVQETEEINEAFTIAFSDDGSSLSLTWDRTMVSVPVAVNTQGH